MLLVSIRIFNFGFDLIVGAVNFFLVIYFYRMAIFYINKL